MTSPPVMARQRSLKGVFGKLAVLVSLVSFDPLARRPGPFTPNASRCPRLSERFVGLTGTRFFDAA